MRGFFYKILEKITNASIRTSVCAKSDKSSQSSLSTARCKKDNITVKKTKTSVLRSFVQHIFHNLTDLFYIIGFVFGSFFLFFLAKIFIFNVIFDYDKLKNNNELRLFLSNKNYLLKENHLLYPIKGKEIDIVQLQNKDNLSNALIKKGFDRNNVNDVLKAMYQKVDLRSLQENQRFYVEYDYTIYMKKIAYTNQKKRDYQHIKPELYRPFEERVITKLSFKLPRGAKYKVERNDGGYILHIEKPTLIIKTHIISGTIKNNLFVDALVSDINTTTLYNMLNEYAFLIDFQRDLHKGDQFIFVLETTRDNDGDFVGEKVLYSNLILSGRKHEIFNYNGKFYDRLGKSIQKNLLKTPVDGARISSGFQAKRKHPILGYTRAHKGIDLAVPMGTPIYSAGDGVVTEVQLNHDAYGKFVTIRHNREYSTRYAHMSRIAHLRVGQFVKQRQVIGYVGMTGLATGPHLHYEVMRYGKHINPKNIKAVETKKLDKNKFEELIVKIKKIDEMLKN